MTGRGTKSLKGKKQPTNFSTLYPVTIDSQGKVYDKDNENAEIDLIVLFVFTCAVTFREERIDIFAVNGAGVSRNKEFMWECQ